MPRLPLVVRDAVPGDAGGLVALWSGAGYPADAATSEPGEHEGAIVDAAADPDQRIVVGEYEGQVVAAIHMRRAPIGPLARESAVHTSFLAVAPEHRRHGYAHLMLEAAVAWAEEKDIARVTAFSAGGSRDTNRFLARLGMGTVATLRVAPTAALRRRLLPTPRGASARAISQVLAQRRSSRHRHAIGSAHH